MPCLLSASTCFAGIVCAHVTRRDNGNVPSVTAPLALMTIIGCTCPHEEEGANSLEDMPRCRVMFCNMLRQHFSFLFLYAIFITLIFCGTTMQYVTIPKLLDKPITYFAKFLLRT